MKRLICVLALVALPIFAFADGSYIYKSASGECTNGMQLDDLNGLEAIVHGNALILKNSNCQGSYCHPETLLMHNHHVQKSFATTEDVYDASGKLHHLKEKASFDINVKEANSMLMFQPMRFVFNAYEHGHKVYKSICTYNIFFSKE